MIFRLRDFDDAYAKAPHIAGAERFPPAWAAAAEAFRRETRQAGRAQLDLAYGPKPPNRGVVAEFVEEPDRHHYDVIDGLADPQHRLTRALVAPIEE